MTNAECKCETQKHIEKVRKYIRFMTDKMTTRGVNHDSVKLDSPEVEIFAEHTECLKDLEYNSPEYKQHLDAMKVALDHHYANCRHHPEHFQNGINDMNLIDIVEMLCDWEKIVSLKPDWTLLPLEEVYKRKMSDFYLTVCYYNLAEKHECGMFDEFDEIEKIYRKVIYNE